jgi:uncharacterized protein (TIGR03083 family)
MCDYDRTMPEGRQSEVASTSNSLHGPLGIRDVRDLFAPLHRELIVLLRGLTPEQWELPTVAGAWLVRDVAAHLLDGDLRIVSAHRDGHLPRAAASTYEEVLALINAQNASAVAWAQRLSTRLLVELLEVSGAIASAFLESLDPHAPALFPVAWAGESESKNWMDTGREYTERWHHQMQIRDAVGAPPRLLEREWLEPLLDFSLRALPRAYATVEAPVGTAILLQVGEDAWTLRREEARWQLFAGAAPSPSVTVRLPPAIAWQLLYNALPPERARSLVDVVGDTALADPLFTMRSVMV